MLMLMLMLMLIHIGAGVDGDWASLDPDEVPPSEDASTTLMSPTRTSEFLIRRKSARR